MARPAVIPWADADTAAGEGAVRTRLHALCLLRQSAAGWTPTTVAASLGVQCSTVQQWLKWYREGAWPRCAADARAGWASPPT